MTYNMYFCIDPFSTRVYAGLGYASEIRAVSDGDSVMSTSDQGALLSCHEASPLEAGITALCQEC